MGYILLLIVVILFVNKQNIDFGKFDYKNTIDKRKIDNKNNSKRNLQNAYENNYILKDNLPYDNVGNKIINKAKSNKYGIQEKKKFKKFDRIDDNIFNESCSNYKLHTINKKYENNIFYKFYNQEVNVLNEDINSPKIKTYLDNDINNEKINSNLYNNMNDEKDNDYINKEEININLDSNTSHQDIEVNSVDDIGKIFNDNKQRIFDDSNQHVMVDLYEDIDDFDENQEIYKTNIIEDITEKIEEEDNNIRHKYIIDKNSNEEKCNFNKLKTKYRGVNISVLIKEIGLLEGEIVFDFPNIIALKNKENIIIFIDESKILGIF